MVTICIIEDVKIQYKIIEECLEKFEKRIRDDESKQYFIFHTGFLTTDMTESEFLIEYEKTDIDIIIFDYQLKWQGSHNFNSEELMDTIRIKSNKSKQPVAILTSNNYEAPNNNGLIDHAKSKNKIVFRTESILKDFFFEESKHADLFILLSNIIEERILSIKPRVELKCFPYPTSLYKNSGSFQSRTFTDLRLEKEVNSFEDFVNQIKKISSSIKLRIEPGKENIYPLKLQYKLETTNKNFFSNQMILILNVSHYNALIYWDNGEISIMLLNQFARGGRAKLENYLSANNIKLETSTSLFYNPQYVKILDENGTQKPIVIRTDRINVDAKTRFIDFILEEIRYVESTVGKKNTEIRLKGINPFYKLFKRIR